MNKLMYRFVATTKKKKKKKEIDLFLDTVCALRASSVIMNHSVINCLTVFDRQVLLVNSIMFDCQTQLNNYCLIQIDQQTFDYTVDNLGIFVPTEYLK